MEPSSPKVPGGVGVGNGQDPDKDRPTGSGGGLGGGGGVGVGNGKDSPETVKLSDEQKIFVCEELFEFSENIHETDNSKFSPVLDSLESCLNEFKLHPKELLELYIKTQHSTP